MARPNESELIVPLRNAWNITRYKRAPRAMQIIREQVIRHLKVREDEELYIDPEVNEHIWKRGIEIHHAKFVCCAFVTTNPTSLLK